MSRRWMLIRSQWERGALVTGVGTGTTNNAPTDIALSVTSIAENAGIGSLVATISGTDPEGDALTFSLAADPDAKFSVSGTQLLLAAALDYETKTTHSVTIQASDGINTYQETFIISVTNVAEPATITSSAAFTQAENAAFSTTLAASQSVTWSKVGGSDASLFSLSGSTLSLPAQDYEAPKDSDFGNTYVVTVRATNGSGDTTDQTITVTVSNAADNGIAPPTVTATYVFARDIDAGTTLYEKAPDTQVAPASLTKLATAVLLSRMKGSSLSDTVTITSADEVDGTAMGLQVGDVITYQDLLWGMILPSSNDSTYAVGRTLGDGLTPGGGLTRFIQATNDLAHELGMSHTVFQNTSGIDQTGHLSTARDIAILASTALTDSIIRPVADTASHSISVTGPSPRSISLTHTGSAIVSDTGVVAVKTGNTTNAGYCLALLWQAPNGNRVVIVTIHSTDATTQMSDMRSIIGRLPADYHYLDTTAPTISSSASQTTPENADWSMALAASEAVTWTKTGGADAALFTLSGSTLSMAAKNYEAPADANGDNIYVVQVTATDVAGNTASQTISVTVTDVVETTPTTGARTDSTVVRVTNSSIRVD